MLQSNVYETPHCSFASGLFRVTDESWTPGLVDPRVAILDA
jgi:hypothetical protein